MNGATENLEAGVREDGEVEFVAVGTGAVVEERRKYSRLAVLDEGVVLQRERSRGAGGR